MSTRVFINLPVADLPRAKAFYTALGYTIDPRFTNDNAACVVVSETICVMLLVHRFFATFTPNAICPTRTHTEAIVCLSADDKAGVDALAERALAAGGGEPKPVQDPGGMYGRSFTDPDGHHWEVVFMPGLPAR